MKIVTDKIRRIFSGNIDALIVKKSFPFDLIKSPKGILRELLISKETGNLVGLISPALGEGMFFVLVLCVEDSSNTIAFQKYDISNGRILLASKLSINDIKGVCPFINTKRPPFRPDQGSFF